MGIFDRFPYSSTHEMNLDFMLGRATEIAEDMQQVTAGMEQVQAGLSAISEKTEQATQAAAQAAQSASSIEGSVTAAEEAAEEAQMHNESAQTWANNAMTYKADCQRSATEAAASSSSAAQAATAAAGSEDTVAQYAQAANASAQSAANNNDSAHQYANQASASASNATFHSSNAQTAATNAQTAATNANTSATNASASADRAASLKTDVENLVESLPEDFTDLNNTVNQLSDEIDTLDSDVTNLKSALSEYYIKNYEGNGPSFNSSYDLDNATSNTRILWFVPAATLESNFPAHWPSDAKSGGRWEFYTHTNILADSSEGYKCQLLLSAKGLWYRSNTGSSWSSWDKIGRPNSDVTASINAVLNNYLSTSGGGVIQNYPDEITNNVSTLSDLNYASGNAVYHLYFTNSYSSRPSHWISRTEGGYFILITYEISNTRKYQLLYGINTGLYMRMYTGNWGVWEKIGWLENEIKTLIQKEIIIAADGSGDYTSFKEGIEAAQLMPNCTVRVKSGTYDLFEEWGGSAFAQSYTYATVGGGLAVGNGMHIICDSKALIKYEYTWEDGETPNADLIENFSPLNSGSLGDFVIENMNIRAKNCRYVFHDELAGSVTPQNHKFINCQMYLDNTGNSVWNNKPCIGGGLGSDEEVIIDSCCFEAVTDGTNIAGASYHNTDSSNARSVVLIKNSYCADHNTFMGTARGASTLISEFIVTGCSCYTAPSIGQATGNANMVLKAWMNEVRSN